jgi:hypothetical protein
VTAGTGVIDIREPPFQGFQGFGAANVEGVEQTADRVVGAGQHDQIDDSGVSERFSGLGKRGIVDAV